LSNKASMPSVMSQQGKKK